jgi:hypothetical protein
VYHTAPHLDLNVARMSVCVSNQMRDRKTAGPLAAWRRVAKLKVANRLASMFTRAFRVRTCHPNSRIV